MLAAASLSRLAERMLSLAIILYALTRFASPALAGWLTCAAVLPGLLISPLTGALLDRIGSTSAVIADMTASAVTVLALIAADQLGWTSQATLLTIVALFSLTSPLSAVGIRTLLPRLVPSHALDRVNALDTAIHAASEVCGPALAGLLVGSAGPVTTLGVIAAGPIDVGLLTLRQRRTDPTQFGRVMAVSMTINLAGFPLGSALAGMLITQSASATSLQQAPPPRSRHSRSD